MFDNINEMSDAMYGLLEKGFVEIAGINEEGELTYRLTKKGKDFAENYEG
mgnify:FL=1|tara:strand:- start:1299 stop:1448 length:150 start_codon:yes stop_codon:yes gene_type:complete